MEVKSRAIGARRGVTLVELLAAMLVLGILVLVGFPQYQKYLVRMQVQQATTDIIALAAKIDYYYNDSGQYPVDLSVVGCSATSCIDPWGNPYQYIDHALTKGNGHVRRDRSLNPLNNDYDLYSMGQDGLSSLPITQKDSLDDVIRASNGHYFGLASNF